jgi:hypothetical protein
MMERIGMRRIKYFFAFPFTNGRRRLPMRKKKAGCIHLSIEVLVF